MSENQIKPEKFTETPNTGPNEKYIHPDVPKTNIEPKQTPAVAPSNPPQTPEPNK